MKLNLGFSPCPNDTFIFDALVHGKIDTEDLEFRIHLDDVETLNEKAFQGEAEITKLSFHALAHVAERYRLLDSGAALGFGVGPLLIAHTEEAVAKVLEGGRAITSLKVGIPGRYTTANFLLGLAYPGLERKEVLRFSEIEQALLDGSIDLGLIIHENRFTYQQKGLKKVIDLGDFWEHETGFAIPLGGIAIRRDLGMDLALKVDRLIRKSVEYAFANPKSATGFIRSHAQEMDEEVMFKHIDLYVNRFSIDLGADGRTAVDHLFSRARALGIIPPYNNDLFLPRDKS